MLDPLSKDGEQLPFSATLQGAAVPVKVAQPVAWAMSPARLVAFDLLSKPCQVVSTAAEKIGIDHIARVVPQGALHTSALACSCPWLALEMIHV